MKRIRKIFRYFDFKRGSPSLVFIVRILNVKNRKFLDASTSKTNSPSLVPIEEVEHRENFFGKFFNLTTPRGSPSLAHLEGVVS